MLSGLSRCYHITLSFNCSRSQQWLERNRVYELGITIRGKVLPQARTTIVSYYSDIAENNEEFVVSNGIRNRIFAFLDHCSKRVLSNLSLPRKVLRPIFTQENKHGIGPDRNKIEPAHGLSVPIFCSSLNL